MKIFIKFSICLLVLLSIIISCSKQAEIDIVVIATLNVVESIQNHNGVNYAVYILLNSLA